MSNPMFELHPPRSQSRLYLPWQASIHTRGTSRGWLFASLQVGCCWYTAS